MTRRVWTNNITSYNIMPAYVYYMVVLDVVSADVTSIWLSWFYMNLFFFTLWPCSSIYILYTSFYGWIYFFFILLRNFIFSVHNWTVYYMANTYTNKRTIMPKWENGRKSVKRHNESIKRRQRRCMSSFKLAMCMCVLCTLFPFISQFTEYM